jgi:hypothetical protein
MGTRQLAAYRKKYFPYEVQSLPTRDGREVPLQLAGAPTNNVSFLGQAVVGSLVLDTTNGKLYIVTATNGTSTITYASVGSQV